MNNNIENMIIKFEQKAIENKGTRIRIRAGLYYYQPKFDLNPERGCYQIEFMPDGWYIERVSEWGEWNLQPTLGQAIEAINIVCEADYNAQQTRRLEAKPGTVVRLGEK